MLRAISICCILLLAGLVMPIAVANTPCDNELGGDDTVLVVLGIPIGVDTGGDGNGFRAACVGHTSVTVNVNPNPYGQSGRTTGAKVNAQLCNDTTCTPILGFTGAGIGPGTGISCTLGECVYVWVNDVNVLP